MFLQKAEYPAAAKNVLFISFLTAVQ